jgi:hypothetical protein
MARKTVARRHSKVLPMSTDLDDLIRRDDSGDDPAEERQELPARPPLRSITEKLDALASQPPATPEPDFIDAELGGQIEFGDAQAPDPDPFEAVRELARADAEKRIRRMAPTKLSAEEKEVYLQAFDAHRAAEAG